MTEVFDACVIGAGVVGSSSARYLASCGKKTLLLEQFPLPHGRGNSHGQGRIIRHAYDFDTYAKMMPDAFKMWREIEEMDGTQLIVENGLLCIQNNVEETKKVANILDKMNIEHEVFEGHALKKTYPMLQIGDNFTAVLEKSAGTIRADKSLRCLQSQFVRFGGVLHDSEKVVEIIPGSVVVVKTNKGEYRTNSLIITPGAWAARLLKHLGLHLPLEVVRIDVCYWKVQDADMYSAEKGFPNLIFIDADEPEIKHSYALSCLEYPQLLKFCNHVGPVIDPDTRDRGANKSEIMKLSNFVRHHFLGVECTPSIVESCMYTVTPDGHFIVDNHPHFKNIAIGAGFSGHGFKMAPVVGKILAQLAQGEKPEYNINICRLSRFGRTSKAAL